MFTFGFSYVGLIFLLMLFIPNIIWTKNKPADYDKYVNNENRFLRALEKIGEVLCTCCALIFSDLNIRKTPWVAFLALAFALMLLYEVYWVRYFRSEKKMSDFYRGICGIPLAGATLPVAAFLLLGIYGSNILLIVSSIILGIGHVGIHRAHEREISGEKKRKSIFGRILRGVGTTILVLLLIVASIVIGGRNVNYLRHYRNIADGVDEGIFVELGGQEQYILARGEHKDNPVIIYLHGGPSSPDTYATYAFTDLLTDRYTVIGWDQRGCGRTYFRNIDTDPDNTTATFEQALTDLDELVDYACERFGQDKVIIMGHSYGTILGGQYAATHPDKVARYVGVGQVVNLEKSDVYSYEDALVKAEDAGDDTSAMVAAYEKVQQTGALEDLMALRGLVSVYHPVEKPDHTTLYSVMSPYFGCDDMRWFLRQLGDTNKYYALNEQLFDYTFAADMSEYTEYQVPVTLITAWSDWICPADSVKDYFDSITAPEKNIYIMNGCGHYPQYSDPEEFVAIPDQFAAVNEMNN